VPAGFACYWLLLFCTEEAKKSKAASRLQTDHVCKALEAGRQFVRHGCLHTSKLERTVSNPRMPVVLLLGSLLAMLVFLIWERRRSAKSPVTPLTRAALENGWRPKQTPKWRASVGFGLLFVVLALIEWRHPKSPPFTGRWSQVTSFFHTQFGTYGVAYLWAAFAVLLFLAAALQYRAGAHVSHTPGASNGPL
jgi:hypothetical protein